MAERKAHDTICWWSVFERGYARRLQKIVEPHRPCTCGPGSPVCLECYGEWPCPTVQLAWGRIHSPVVGGQDNG